MTSISPVGRFGFWLPSGRADTSPVTRTQNSERSWWATVLVAYDHLDDPAGLTQVEEGDAAVVAATGHPAGEGDGLADVVGAQGAGLMGADQRAAPSEDGAWVETTWGRRSWAGGAQVPGSASTWSPLRMSLT